MEPRWKHDWLQDKTKEGGQHCVFLGGTNTYDLWLDVDGDLRMVRGESLDEWDYYAPNNEGGLDRISYEMTVTTEEWDEVLRYLKLFVPDWAQRRP
jgi:hypothetical protein